MIYITGDCHADFRKFNTEAFPEQKEMTKDDYVIICGDFGGVWLRDEESKHEKFWMDWLESKSYTTLFVDGNHENFDRLYAYPEEEWNGGKVHKIRPSVIHLMRGQVFELQGKKIFTFGGARSHDIDGGILDMNDPDFLQKRKQLDADWIPYRINHLTWWKEELPSEEEMEEGRRNLEANNHDVDFVVTHCSTADIEHFLKGKICETDYLNDYFEEIKQKTQYKKWFCGHYHENRNVSSKEIVIYEQIIRIA